MLRALPLIAAAAALLASAPSALACKAKPLTDLELADRSDLVFIGRLVVLDAERPRATYLIERPLKGDLVRGRRITIRHCGSAPQRRPARHIVFADDTRLVTNGFRSIREKWPEAHAELLARWLTAADPAARAALLLERYRSDRDRMALQTLIDAPALVAQLDDETRRGLVRTIGSAAWTRVEVAALARLREPTGTALLRIAAARCDGTGDFGTPCDADVSNALVLLERPTPPKDRRAYAVMMRSGEPFDRLLALDRCELARREPYDAGFYWPTFTTRFDPASVGLLQDHAAWERAAAWCEGPTSPAR